MAEIGPAAAARPDDVIRTPGLLLIRYHVSRSGVLRQSDGCHAPSMSLNTTEPGASDRNSACLFSDGSASFVARSAPVAVCASACFWPETVSGPATGAENFGSRERALIDEADPFSQLVEAWVSAEIVPSRVQTQPHQPVGAFVVCFVQPAKGFGLVAETGMDKSNAV